MEKVELTSPLVFDGCEVFSATKAQERAELGAKITAWRQANAGKRVVARDVNQSSDNEFHCLSIILWYTNQ